MLEIDSKFFLSRAKFFIPIALSSLILDQWSKAWAIAHVKGSPESYFFNIFSFVYAENTGAWGNLGANWPYPLKDIFLLYLPTLVLLGIAIFALVGKKIRFCEMIAFSFIFSGGIGNIIDRFRYDHVVDFMYIGLNNGIGTNIFNIADVSIMTGFFLLILDSLFKKKEKAS